MAGFCQPVDNFFPCLCLLFSPLCNFFFLSSLSQSQSSRIDPCTLGIKNAAYTGVFFFFFSSYCRNCSMLANVSKHSRDFTCMFSEECLETEKKSFRIVFLGPLHTAAPTGVLLHHFLLMLVCHKPRKSCIFFSPPPLSCCTSHAAIFAI